MRKGNVYVFNVFAGVIEETDDGKYIFTYDDLYVAKEGAKPVSISMPVTKKTYTNNFLFPFFDGLIPEGWILNLTIKNWKIDPKDRMRLLLTACRDCIGAVHVTSCDENGNESEG
ncbi:MAG: HipA N-terminal domain-containing protein [Oligoflexia bacterium]|nr:HipA N-terminal domain-containing protein [Oligoflexia bacterium]